MSVLDVIVLLAFVAIAVVGAEVVRRTCRRQLSSIPAHTPATPATSSAATTIGPTEVD